MCSYIAKGVIFYKKGKLVVVSSVRIQVNLTVLFYIHIYHSSFTHECLFHSLVYSTTNYSKVIEQNQFYRSKTRSYKDLFCIKKVLIVVREAELLGFRA